MQSMIVRILRAEGGWNAGATWTAADRKNAGTNNTRATSNLNVCRKLLFIAIVIRL